MEDMPRKPPKIDETASDQARRIHAFLLERGLTARGWAKKAGISPSLLTEVFSGRTRSVTYANLLRLAKGAGCSPSQIVGSEAMSSMESGQSVTIGDVYLAVHNWAMAECLPDPVGSATAVVAILSATLEEEDNRPI